MRMQFGQNCLTRSLYFLRCSISFIPPQGMHYPAAYTLLSRWSPVQERGTHLSACVIGTHSGIVLSMSLTGYLCEKGGWQAPFYLLGECQQCSTVPNPFQVEALTVICCLYICITAGSAGLLLVWKSNF